MRYLGVLDGTTLKVINRKDGIEINESKFQRLVVGYAIRGDSIVQIPNNFIIKSPKTRWDVGKLLESNRVYAELNKIAVIRQCSLLEAIEYLPNISIDGVKVYEYNDKTWTYENLIDYLTSYEVKDVRILINEELCMNNTQKYRDIISRSNIILDLAPSFFSLSEIDKTTINQVHKVFDLLESQRLYHASQSRTNLPQIYIKPTYFQRTYEL